MSDTALAKNYWVVQILFGRYRTWGAVTWLHLIVLVVAVVILVSHSTHNATATATGTGTGTATATVSNITRHATPTPSTTCHDIT